MLEEKKNFEIGKNAEEAKEVEKKEYHIAENKKKKKGKLSTGAKVGIGLGIGCVVIIIAIIAIAWFIYIRAVDKVTEEYNKLESFQDYSEKYQYNPPQPGELYDEISEEEDLEEVAGNIEEVLSDGEVEIRINSVDKKSSINGQKPYQENEYWVVSATIRNVSGEDINIFTSNFTIEDENENSYYIAYLGEENIKDSIPTWHYLPKKEEISGNVILEVKKEVKNLKIHYAGKKMLIFDLKN